MSDPDAPEQPEDRPADQPDDRPEATEDHADARIAEPDPETPAHEPTGLDLARTIAHAVSASRGRSRRWRQQRGERPARPVDPRSSGAHPDDRDPQPLGSVVDRLVESQGWTREVSVHLILGKWPSLVGIEVAAHSTPVGYSDGVLRVRTGSTAWATQLRLMAPRLVARLNEALGDGTVTRVDIKGPDAPSWKHGRRSVRGRGPRDTYG
ncbi:putative nucleic acid-binding Zn ribbon protein [Friedmanniella endophytica]|uniref:Putative nucleic acid-binding Zn ribbon protein n=1 Tax=Microlunatus kandeliicorticis TaxID=1759536 RepID=A0A7W3IR12_9ACTN|nr:DciA family protein [Microlunatus kandeliicorticis]MBA8793652.1 putative nucleic acid-binding Zn ribbon protein [Microlunatus kandeliicorticis]